MSASMAAFGAFQLVAFLLITLALVLLGPAQRPFLISAVALLVPWFFAGPGFGCDHYQLLGALRRLEDEPLILGGWWLAIPWCYLGVRAAYQRLRPERRAPLKELGTWMVVSILIGYVGPSGGMGNQPVVILGWFMTIVLAYLGGRALVERVRSKPRASFFPELLVAIVITAAIAVPVETFGSLAGLWQWRFYPPGIPHESWIYGAYDRGACPPFTPYPTTGLLPFPLDEALGGWCAQHVLAPVAFLLVV
ncbi:MAG: hypothetical protein KC656_36250, partial [Myxococcales bacterium]|nr:hypothetical protein [Myxococcales bacterium]